MIQVAEVAGLESDDKRLVQAALSNCFFFSTSYGSKLPRYVQAQTLGVTEGCRYHSASWPRCHPLFLMLILWTKLLWRKLTKTMRTFLHASCEGFFWFKGNLLYPLNHFTQGAMEALSCLLPEAGSGGRSAQLFERWLVNVLVKLLLNKLSQRMIRAKLGYELLVDCGMLLKILCPRSCKPVLAAGSAPIKAGMVIKLRHLLKKCKFDPNISKLNVQAAEGRLLF